MAGVFAAPVCRHVVLRSVPRSVEAGNPFLRFFGIRVSLATRSAPTETRWKVARNALGEGAVCGGGGAGNCWASIPAVLDRAADRNGLGGSVARVLPAGICLVAARPLEGVGNVHAVGARILRVSGFSGGRSGLST